MWGHNSGFHPPNIYTRKILTYPNLFVFTTPLTYKCDDVKNLSPKEKNLLYNIWSTGGVDRFKSVKPKPHDGFNVGYIGTVDYAKIHPDFLKMCKDIYIPNIKFIVIGGLKEKEIEAEAKKLGIGDKFVFIGEFINDINKYLEIFDVFGYPLAPYHYGTCDLVLQEAMAAGVVPIVLNNPMEEYIVKNGKTGIVAKNKIEYIKAIECLYVNTELQKKLSINAKEYAKTHFSIKKLVTEWKNVFNRVLNFQKTTKKWDINKPITYKDVFLESLGHYGEAFICECNSKIKKIAKINSWQTETKGSVHNYSSYFPNDLYLSKWSKLMKKCR